MNTRLGARTLLLIVADITIVLGGILIALSLRLGIDGTTFQLEENFGWWKVGGATLVCLIALHLFDLYDYAVVSNRRELNLRLVQALGVTWALLAVTFYFFPGMLIGRGTAIYSVAITLVLLVIFRNTIHFVLGHPELGEKILIVGDERVVFNTVEAALKRRDAGHRIVGFLMVGSESNGNGNGHNGNSNGHYPVEGLKGNGHAGNGHGAISGISHLGDIGDLEKIVEYEKIDRIVIGVRERRGSFPADPLLRIRLAGSVNIEESTSFFERVTGQVHLDNLRPSWLIFSFRPRDTRLKMFVREGLYRALAFMGLIVSAPIALLTMMLIKLESSGSCFYRQERVGKNGRPFELIKFRSMKHDAEADGAPVWATTDDDRCTVVGKIIRKIRVDEIPQFWNILKGEMSFIGPRPERPHFVSQLSEEIPYYDHRHLVAPGLTGWAQINFPYGATAEEARQKLQYDLYYIKNQTFTLDLIIMFETMKTILLGKGAR